SSAESVASSNASTSSGTGGSGGSGGSGSTSVTSASSTGPTAASTSTTTAASSSASSGAGGGGACEIFPAANPWNTDISSFPVDTNSASYIAFINANGGNGPLHADFDSVGDGIPFQFVDASVKKSAVTFSQAGESDKGPYPIPANPLIET